MKLIRYWLWSSCGRKVSAEADCLLAKRCARLKLAPGLDTTWRDISETTYFVLTPAEAIERIINADNFIL